MNFSFGVLVLMLIGGFLLLMVLGVPIAFSLAIAAVFTVMVDGSFPVYAIFHRFIGNASSYTLLAIAFFILAAKLMNTGGITRKIFRAASAWVGAIPGVRLVDALKIATEGAGNARTMNMAMAGALSTFCPFPVETWRAAMEELLSGPKAKLLEANWKAFALGREAAAKEA